MKRLMIRQILNHIDEAKLSIAHATSYDLSFPEEGKVMASLMILLERASESLSCAANNAVYLYQEAPDD